MKNSYSIPLLAAISFGAAALVSALVPSLTVPMTLVSFGMAVISTLILLFSLIEAKRQGQLRSAFVAAMIMAAITVALIVWLLPRVQIDQPITPPEITPTGLESL